MSHSELQIAGRCPDLARKRPGRLRPLKLAIADVHVSSLATAGQKRIAPERRNGALILSRRLDEHKSQL
jgi:hypothetical protein